MVLCCLVWVNKCDLYFYFSHSFVLETKESKIQDCIDFLTLPNIQNPKQNKTHLIC